MHQGFPISYQNSKNEYSLSPSTVIHHVPHIFASAFCFFFFYSSFTMVRLANSLPHPLLPPRNSRLGVAYTGQPIKKKTSLLKQVTYKVSYKWVSVCDKHCGTKNKSSAKPRNSICRGAVRCSANHGTLPVRQKQKNRRLLSYPGICF